MIVYSLTCENSHAFEEWFTSGSRFDVMAEAGEIVCPTCGSRHVAKAPMAPAVAGSKTSGGCEMAEAMGAPCMAACGGGCSVR